MSQTLKVHPEVEVTHADFSLPEHAAAFKALLGHYSADPMGGGEKLSDEVLEQSLAGIRALDYSHSFIAFIDGQPTGLINAFQGYSTFKAKPLLNIHDLVVHEDYRRMKVAQAMLAKAERFAIDNGFCKITLEVLEQNIPAQKAYQRFGFEGYELDPASGQALFWQKVL